jgi:O-antigen ligase
VRTGERSADPLARTAHRLALGALWLLFLALPFVLDSAQKDSFRPPKAYLGETLALLSLFLLAFAWKGPAEWRRLARAPFVLTFGPFLLVATLISLASPHTAHVHRGLVGLWIGSLAIWGWSAGFERHELRQALTLQLVPASILALIAILQFHGIYQPYSLMGLAATSRYAIGSLAGNVGDLAACLVLPAILAQAEIANGRRRGLAAAALVLCLYGLAVTQTLAAIVAVALGSAVFWAFHLSRRRALLGAATLVGAGLLLLAVVAPLRERAVAKMGEISRGDWNAVLTGRLDGWRAAVWMLGEHPATGVGVGAYRTEFIHAKLALVRSGVAFFEEQQNVVFANAHNELLEVAAETGWPGLLTFLLGVALLARGLLRRQRSSAGASTAEPGGAAPGGTALAWSGLVAVAILSLANFPFRIAISLWPICLFLAWILAVEPPVTGAAEGEVA